MPRTGRPKLEPSEVRKAFPLRLNDAERRDVEAAAERDGKPTSTWVRETLLRAAAKSGSRKS
jgi:hypothetical protein